MMEEEQHTSIEMEPPKGDQPKDEQPKDDQPKGDQPKDEQPKDDQPKDEPTEIICIKRNDHGHHFEELSYVNQKLETIMQKMKQQMAMLTAAFISLGIIFFHSLVQPTIPLRSKWWIPFCIFLSVSIIYWCTLKNIIRDYFWVRQEYGLTLDHMQKWPSSPEKGIQGTRKSVLATVFDFYRRQIIILYRQNRYLSVLLVAMSAFNALILYACYSFLHG